MWAGDVGHGWEEGVLHDRSQQDVRTEGVGVIVDLVEERVCHQRGIADSKGVAVQPNRSAPVIDPKQRHGIGWRCDLGMVSPSHEVVTGGGCQS